MSQDSNSGPKFLIGAACLVIIVAGLRSAAQLVLPFLVAVFLSVVSVALMAWLQRRRVPRFLAVLSTVLVAAAVVGSLGLVIGQSANEFTDAVPRYQARLQELIDSLLGLAASFGLPTDAWRSVDLLPGDLFDLLGGTLVAVASFASNTLLVFLIIIFILMEAAGFSAKLRAAFGEHAQFVQLNLMMKQVQNYLVLKTLISAGTGTVVGLWVGALGLDFPLLWGLVAFILNFIPSFGSILAAVPAVLLAVVQFGPARAAVIALGYLCINIVFGNFLEPMFMGRRLGLSPLVVFVSLVIWGWIWGPIGMLFSVPLTMVVKIALENTHEFRWVSVMLEANPSAAPPKGISR